MCVESPSSLAWWVINHGQIWTQAHVKPLSEFWQTRNENTLLYNQQSWLKIEDISYCLFWSLLWLPEKNVWMVVLLWTMVKQHLTLVSFQRSPGCWFLFPPHTNLTLSGHTCFCHVVWHQYENINYDNMLSILNLISQAQHMIYSPFVEWCKGRLINLIFQCEMQQASKIWLRQENIDFLIFIAYFGAYMASMWNKLQKQFIWIKKSFGTFYESETKSNQSRIMKCTSGLAIDKAKQTPTVKMIL